MFVTFTVVCNVLTIVHFAINLATSTQYGQSCNVDMAHFILT